MSELKLPLQRSGIFIYGSDGKSIARTHSDDRDDDIAQEMVDTINSHSRLTEEVRGLRETLEAEKREKLEWISCAGKYMGKEENLRNAITRYLAEYDYPVPDYTLQKRYREKLRAALSKEPGNG